MKTNVTFEDFIAAFRNHERGEQFTHEALELIYNRLIKFEEDGMDEYDLNVADICRNYSESTIDEVVNDYDISMESATPENYKVCDRSATLDFVLEGIEDHVGPAVMLTLSMVGNIKSNYDDDENLPSNIDNTLIEAMKYLCMLEDAHENGFIEPIYDDQEIEDIVHEYLTMETNVVGVTSKGTIVYLSF